MAVMRCRKCGKPIKEDTEGNPKYCQGHDMFDAGSILGGGRF